MKVKKLTNGDWDKYQFAIEEWTPEKAKAAVDATPAKKQRVSGRWSIAARAADMIDGRWDKCFDPVVISEEGWVINGMHRLKAIILSGVPQTFPTWRGVEYRCIFHMDLDGDRRKAYQQAHLLGRKINKKQLTLARCFLTNPYGGSGAHKFTTYQQMEAYEQHKEAIDFALGLFGQHIMGVTIGPVIAAIARAYEWGAAPEHLQSFAEILVSGGYDKSEPEGINAVKLRKWLMEAAATGGVGGLQAKYRRAARALIAYIEGEVLTRLFEAGTDPFPLDTDE